MSKIVSIYALYQMTSKNISKKIDLFYLQKKTNVLIELCRFLVYNVNNHYLRLEKYMPKFRALELINLLNSMSEEDKKKKAQSDSVIKDEIKNVLDDTKVILYRQNREDAIKYALWQGLLNQYGIFGSKRTQHRILGKTKENYYDQCYSFGDLIGVDFGTSNVGSEFSFTHTAIVVSAYTDYLVVIPTTSCKDGRLESKPIDEQSATMIIKKDDFPDIESDSYILLYQLRSISRNRVVKRVGTISDSALLRQISQKLFELMINPLYVEYSEKLSQNDAVLPGVVKNSDDFD